MTSSVAADAQGRQIFRQRILESAPINQMVDLEWDIVPLALSAAVSAALQDKQTQVQPMGSRKIILVGDLAGSHGW